MLSIIHRYVLWELIRSFIMSFAILVAVMVLGSIYRPLRIGVSLEDLARFVPYVLPHLYAWVMPAAALSACVMTYGRLSADNELTAMAASGIPLRYVCYPAIVFAIVLTTVSLPLNDQLIPYSSIARDQELHRMLIKEPFRVSLLGSDITTKIGNYKLYVESVQGNILRNVVVIEPKQSEGPPAPKGAPPSPTPRGGAAPHKPKPDTAPEQGSEVTVYRAESATYSVNPAQRKIRIVLHNAQCVMVVPGRSARSWVEITAEEQVKDIPMMDTEVNFERRPNLTTRQLLLRAREWARKAAAGGPRAGLYQKERTHDLTDVRMREAMAFSTLALCFVGVPLGIRLRRQSRLASFAVSVIVYLLLYAMILGGQGMAWDQRLAPWIALWTPDFLAGLAGTGMLLQAFRH